MTLFLFHSIMIRELAFNDFASNLFRRSPAPMITLLRSIAVVMACFVNFVGAGAMAGTWATGWPSDGPPAVYALAVDKSGKVYAGTDRGIYKSGSGGLNWSSASNDSRITQVTALSIASDNIIYAAASGKGVFASLNGGENWSSIGLVGNDITFGVRSFLSLVTDSTGNIFSASQNSGSTAFSNTSIHKRSVGSNAWEFLFSMPRYGAADFEYPKALLVDRRGDVYLGTYRVYYIENSRISYGSIYKSSNSGLTWAKVNISSIPAIKSLISSASGVLFAGSDSGAVYSSIDGGVNWVNAGNGLPGNAVNALTIDAKANLYAGTDGAGVFMSTDSGAKWSAMNNGLSNSAVVNSLSTDTAGRLYAATGTGVYQFSISSSSSTLRVNLVGSSNADIVSSTGHGGNGSYELDVAQGSHVRLSATLSAGNQLFSHWVGCDSNPSTVSFYFNGCDLTMPVSGGKRVTAVYTSPGSKLVNISTRASVLTGDSVLIAGFVISGGPKKVLIKAAGPSMASLNPPVPNTLANPELTLYTGSTPVASNDDWEHATNAADMQASGIAPAHPREAALLTTLNPGPYTVIVEGVSGGTGIGLVSVDDLDPFNSPSRLINISSRAHTSTSGDDQLIAGFILQGAPKELFIAGAGPSMVKAGVPGVLVDPISTFYSGQSILSSNDNWGDSVESSSIDVRTVGDMYTKESALVRALQPGAYTIIMRGNGTPGIGLISVEE